MMDPPALIGVLLLSQGPDVAVLHEPLKELVLFLQLGQDIQIGSPIGECMIVGLLL